MQHSDHEPGTREDCPECQAITYEPGWYKAMRDDRVLGRDPNIVMLPDPDELEVDVVLEEAPHEPARRRR
jgi:hypothetical protein